MLMFKRIYKTRIYSDYWVKIECLIPENERSETEPHARLAAYNCSEIGNDETIEVEARRGWCSWGF